MLSSGRRREKDGGREREERQVESERERERERKRERESNREGEREKERSIEDEIGPNGIKMLLLKVALLRVLLVCDWVLQRVLPRVLLRPVSVPKRTHPG